MSSPNSLEAPGRRESPLSFPPATTGGVDQRAAAKKPGVLARLIVSPLAVRGNFKAAAGVCVGHNHSGIHSGEPHITDTGPTPYGPTGLYTTAIQGMGPGRSPDLVGPT